MSMWKLTKLGDDEHLHIYECTIRDGCMTEEQDIEIRGMTRLVTTMRPIRIDNHILAPLTFTSTYCGMTKKWKHFASFRRVPDGEALREEPLNDVLPRAA